MGIKQLPNFVHRGRSIPLSLHHHDPSRYSNPTDDVACFDPKQKEKGQARLKNQTLKQITFLKPQQQPKTDKWVRIGTDLVGGMGFGERLLGRGFGG